MAPVEAFDEALRKFGPCEHLEDLHLRVAIIIVMNINSYEYSCHE